MKKHVRKWMIAGLVVLAAAPALAGCVAEVGPGYYHHPWYGWHDRDHWRDRDWR